MSCGYQGYEFGAPYLDSICIDGMLWDADSCDVPGGMLYSGGEIPCPQCSRAAWIEHYMDEAKNDGAVAAWDGLPKTPPKFTEDAHRVAWLKGYDEGLAERKVS